MFIFKETNKYSHIKCAFFSRKTGTSNGIYKSLNCGLNTKDKKRNVLKNRVIALKKINLNKKKLIIPNQTHSNKIEIVNENSINKNIAADGLLTKSNKIVLGILTADCAPIFFFDCKKNIISAIHAGWKGAQNGIIQNTIKLMLECGSKLDNIISCVGPCIGKESYKVNNDFFKKFIIEKIKNFGVKKILFGPFDTFKDKKNFFSYRRSLISKEKDYGRCLSVISINGIKK